jgi:hypothetical protein
MKHSGTIRGALLALTAWAGKLVEDTWGAVSGLMDGVKHVAGPETTLSLIATEAKTGLPVLLAALGVAGLVIVMSRRLSAAKEGKIG